MSDKQKNPNPVGARFDDGVPVGERPGGHTGMGDTTSQSADADSIAPSESGPCVEPLRKPRKVSKGEPGSRKPGTELTKDERANQAF